MKKSTPTPEQDAARISRMVWDTYWAYQQKVNDFCGVTQSTGPAEKQREAAIFTLLLQRNQIAKYLNLGLKGEREIKDWSVTQAELCDQGDRVVSMMYLTRDNPEIVDTLSQALFQGRLERQ